MVSPELLRRFTFFGGLSMEQVVALAKVAQETTLEAGQFLFHEGDDLVYSYLVLEGEVALVFELEGRERDVVISDLREGELFGWSGILPPYQATASARATTACHVVAFDCLELRQYFEQDIEFAFVLTQRIAQLLRDRLHGLRIESLGQEAGL
jgi:CRP-like cAMP-binding protein